MKIKDFTFDQLNNIPDNPIPDENKYDSIILVPTNMLHPSGWMCMYYLLCRYDEIICKAGGDSDVLHLDGLGGLGDWRKPGFEISNMTKIKAWKIDCTPNGFIRLHANTKFTIGDNVSDFEIYTEERGK